MLCFIALKKVLRKWIIIHQAIDLRKLVNLKIKARWKSTEMDWNGTQSEWNISIDAKFGLLLTDFSAASKMCSRKIVNGRHFFYFWRFLSSRNQCEKQILLHFQRYSMYINNSNRLSYDTWHFTWKWLVGGNERVKDSFLSLKNSLHDKYGSNP